MKYYSTRSCKNTADGPEAILKGIAPDGGLYTPLDFSAMQIDPAQLKDLSAIDISAEVIGKLLPDFTRDEMRDLITAAYTGRFQTDELTPVVSVADAYVLELFHGPTSAFKDVALSVLPRLITASREKVGETREIVILTATSGDTGKAALEGFRDVPGTRIAVFYPNGGVSDVQKAQMVTQEGKNVRVCAIHGNFDDAQTGVKSIFANDSEKGWANDSGAILSSANSINLGRLAPQVAYYFKSYIDLVNTNRIALGDEVSFVVPTGNFGDILAGELARRMGLPVAKLICASNANNVLTDFIRTGCYDRRRDFHKTISPSMDILVSSNLERYLFLASDGDDALVSELMEQLRNNGFYRIPADLLSTMRERFESYCASDAQAKEVIGRVWKESGYLLDPHTAVAWYAMEEYRKEYGATEPMIVLATASPYKFAKDVLGALTENVPDNGFEAMELLEKLTNVPVPANLSRLKGKTARFSDCIAPDEMCEYVQRMVSE